MSYLTTYPGVYAGPAVNGGVILITMPRNFESINQLLRQSLAEILIRDVEIPKDFFITVVKVDCAQNIKTANAYLSILPFNKKEEALAYIINRRGEIQKFLGDRINLQFTPKLRFMLDTTEQTADEIYAALDRIKE